MNLDRNKASVVDAIDAGLLAGAVTLVWHAGEVRQVNELGYRDVDAQLPMQRDTIFRIASMTKPITVAAAMSLIEEGKLSLTDRVATWLPELADMQVLTQPRGPLDRTVPAQRHITIDDLMTHRSGLAYMFSVLGPLSDAYRKLPTRQDQDKWLSELTALPLVHQPGERLTYSHATDVLGIALSRIEGKPLSDVLTERVLGPLGMSDTGFSVGAAGRRRAATMYQLDKDNTLRHDVMGPAPIVDPPFCTGGAGLWSTADDYLRFARMLLAGGTLDGVRVLSEESVSLMRTDRLTDEQKRHDFLGAPFWIGRGFGGDPFVAPSVEALGLLVQFFVQPAAILDCQARRFPHDQQRSILREGPGLQCGHRVRHLLDQRPSHPEVGVPTGGRVAARQRHLAGQALPASGLRHSGCLFGGRPFGCP